MARSRDDDAGDREDDAPRSRRRQDDEDEFEPRHRTPVKSNDSGLVLGIIGLVFGTFSLLFSAIPCIGMLAFWPGVISAVISALGLLVSVRSRVVPIIALAVSVLAIGISLWQEGQANQIFGGGQERERARAEEKRKVEQERVEREKQGLDKVGRAKSEMTTIKKAYEAFNARNGGQWPEKPSDVYPLLQNGAKAFQSPWPGVSYTVEIADTPQPDGSVVSQPVVTCQPPGLPLIVVPDLTKDR